MNEAINKLTDDLNQGKFEITRCKQASDKKDREIELKQILIDEINKERSHSEEDIQKLETENQ